VYAIHVGFISPSIFIIYKMFGFVSAEKSPTYLKK